MNASTISQGGVAGRAEPPEGEEEWQRRARAFSRDRLRLYGVRTAASLLFLFLFWYSGAASWLAGAVATPQLWLTVMLFLLVYQATVALLFLPFSYYGGFVLQHRYGLSTQRARGWLSDWVKGSLLGAVFFVLGMEGYYLLLAAFPNDWWWMLAIGLSLVALLLSYVAPVVLLPIFYRCSPLEDEELVGRIERLARRCGARVSRVCAINLSKRTTAANAALAGMGRTRQVLLGDTMLRQFSHDEVETVVAHELGHHVHGDIWKGLAVEVGGSMGGACLSAARGPAAVLADGSWGHLVSGEPAAAVVAGGGGWAAADAGIQCPLTALRGGG